MIKISFGDGSDSTPKRIKIKTYERPDKSLDRINDHPAQGWGCRNICVVHQGCVKLHLGFVKVSNSEKEKSDATSAA